MFEWDEDKSRSNLLRRGFDFGFGSRIFESDWLEYEDRRRDYGERRYVALGEVEGQELVIVYTWRGTSRWLISARLASSRERDAYRETFYKANR